MSPQISSHTIIFRLARLIRLVGVIVMTNKFRRLYAEYFCTYGAIVGTYTFIATIEIAGTALGTFL
jgi:hypothetical protein